MVAPRQEKTPLAVLDASAILALYFGEPGADRVAATLPGALVSAVNYTEVVGKALDRGEALPVLLRKLSAMGFAIIPYDAELARRAGVLRPLTRRAGMSLADRACLALAEREGTFALTADRQWKSLGIGIEVQLIR